MKHIRRLAFLFASLFFATTINAQVSSADMMIQKLFTTLKNKDEKSFVALSPNAKQMGGLVRSIMETMFKSPEMKNMMAMDEKSKNMNIDSLIDAQVSQVTKPETQAEMEKSYAKNFNETIEKGEKKGVNWSQSKFVSVQMDSTADIGDEEMKMFAGAGIKNLKGVIDFNSAGTDYQMNFDKVLFIPTEGGWFGGEFKQVIKKGESFAAETPDKDVEADTITTETKKPAAKTQTKTDSNKTKTKTKTPATKTKTKTKV